MRRIFGRTPAEYVASSERALAVVLDAKAEEPKKTKSNDKLERMLKEMKFIFYGDGDKPVDTNKVTKLIRELRTTQLTANLVMNIEKLGFEIPKSVAKILTYWLHDKGSYNDAITYFERHRQLIPHLVNNFEKEEIALPCSEIVKEALVHPRLLKIAFDTNDGEVVYKILAYLKNKDVAFASEAYTMLDSIINCRQKDPNISSDMQKEHQKLVAKWLDANYEKFWKRIHAFLDPKGSHLIMEQMLKLVYQVLKTHRNYNIMMKYINEPENLKIVMKLLRVQNKKIQVMAFNVFKIFFANPEKNEKIVDILLPNLERIHKFLKLLGEDDDLEGKFEDDLQVLQEQLDELKKLKKTRQKEEPISKSLTVPSYLGEEGKQPARNPVDQITEEVKGATLEEAPKT
mmetsp:Transcript_11758/g.22651  ORF Transcript_11758/g.22651 Transcript_11758/m.22651 type:complete len:401 (-) Transcript_11758:198-1400(-)